MSTTHSPTTLRAVVDGLRQIFGARLVAVVGYGQPKAASAPSLALVADITLEDLAACAARTASWHREGCATPLVQTNREFERSLDAFPIEYGEIIATHYVAWGTDPFDGMTIAPADLRRAIEVQAKSHLLHLREDFLEGGGRPANVAALVRESAPGFAALLRHLARLDEVPVAKRADLVTYASRHIRLNERVVEDILALAETDGAGSIDAARLFPPYLAATEQLAEFADRWRQQ